MVSRPTVCGMHPQSYSVVFDEVELNDEFLTPFSNFDATAPRYQCR